GQAYLPAGRESRGGCRAFVAPRAGGRGAGGQDCLPVPSGPGVLGSSPPAPAWDNAPWAHPGAPIALWIHLGVTAGGRGSRGGAGSGGGWGGGRLARPWRPLTWFAPPTPPLPATHAAVANPWQSRGAVPVGDRTAVTSATSCRTSAGFVGALATMARTARDRR